MCLYSLSTLLPTEQEGEGWKVFEQTQAAQLAAPFYGHNYYRTNEWIIDQASGSIETEDCNQYPTGFHIFIHKRDAEILACDLASRHVVKKVKYRSAVAKGLQEERNREEFAPVIVATEMFILEEP
jgi:hypothetical protein